MISVNGVDLTDLTTQQVTSILQQAPDNVTMVMSWGTATNTPTKLADPGCGVGMQFRVALERGGSGFGFSTRTGASGLVRALWTSTRLSFAWRRRPDLRSPLRPDPRRLLGAISRAAGHSPLRRWFVRLPRGSHIFS